MNFTTIKIGKVTIIHHSTSSIVQINVDAESDDPREDQVLWLDYYDLDNLKDAIKKIENE